MGLSHLWTPLAQAAQTPLSALDLALANALQARQPSADVRHRWLAALVSHQWSQGHACLRLDALARAPAALLAWSDAAVQALPEALAEAARDLPWCVGAGSPLVWSEDGQRLYLRRAWQAEQHIRAAVRARADTPLSLPVGWQDRLDALFPASASTAPGTQGQRQACAIAAQHSLSLITGGPGTGKTTTVARLLALLLGLQPELRIALAAPTGKAAARLGESIGAALSTLPATVRARIPTQAQTLHRWLQVGHETAPRLSVDVVIVDEASMIDLEMMARLLQAVPAQARLVLLGDRDQLASVEAGAVMAQLCDMPELAGCTARLTHSHRFDPARGIGRWAQAVQNSDPPDAVSALWAATPGLPDAHAPWPDVTRLDANPSDAQWTQLLQHGWRDWRARLAALAQPRAVHDATALALLHDFARFGVLCATREGPQGVARMTRRVERLLHMPAADALGWYSGRPVMVTRNDPSLGLMNGDIGLCLPHPQGGWRVAFADTDAQGQARVRWLQAARLGPVETVWAMTVHKSQGSEFAQVLLVLPEQMSPVLTRELVYTGLTRARERLTLWAPNGAVLPQACKQRVVRSGGLVAPRDPAP